MAGKIVVDTPTSSAPGGAIDLGHPAARHNADRLPGARYTKCFNTLTAAFQAQAATRTGNARVVQWLCGDDAKAKAIVGRLVDDAGYVPVDLGGIDQCAVMEAPRRPGAVYGRSTAPPTPPPWWQPSGQADRSHRHHGTDDRQSAAPDRGNTAKRSAIETRYLCLLDGRHALDCLSPVPTELGSQTAVRQYPSGSMPPSAICRWGACEAGLSE